MAKLGDMFDFAAIAPAKAEETVAPAAPVEAEKPSVVTPVAQLPAPKPVATPKRTKKTAAKAS